MKQHTQWPKLVLIGSANCLKELQKPSAETLYNDGTARSLERIICSGEVGAILILCFES